MLPHLKIGTHNGTFHCDEVLACVMLKMLPEYEDAEIIRSRKDDVLDACDIVVDVGEVFDHDRKRYDHHQNGFKEKNSGGSQRLFNKFKANTILLIDKIHNVR